MGKSTAQTTQDKSIHGPTDNVKLAALILPILVRQAKAHKTITYGALAKEINSTFEGLHADPHFDIPRSLGIIGNTLKQMENPPPPINVCVVNQKSQKPSNGVDPFVPLWLPNYKPENRSDAIEYLQNKCFYYPRWDEVLHELGLKSAVQSIPDVSSHRYYGGGGESDEHRCFKESVSEQPEKLNLPRNMKLTVEYPLESGDRLDVVLENKKMIVGVEVKSHRSDDFDILRGLFQVVKYQAVLTAMERLSETPRKVKVFLVLENALPVDLVWVQNTLGVEVIDSFGGPQK